MKAILAKLALFLAMFSGPYVLAGERMPAPDGEKVTAVYRIRFVVDKYEIRPELYGNAEKLASLGQLLDSLTTAEVQKPFEIAIVSSASPEGPDGHNGELSDNRYAALKDYLLERYPSLRTKEIAKESLGVDWPGLESALEKSDYAWKNQVLLIIRETPVWVTDKRGRIVDSRKKKLMDFKGGEPWKTMLADIFPDLRRSEVTIKYEKAPVVVPPAETEPPVEPQPPVDTVVSRPYVQEPPVVAAEPRKAGFLIYTNALYDLGLVPNLGTQFYLGRGIALNARWGYGWWDIDPRHYYWRAYGGELTLRKYFSRPEDNGSGLFRSSLGHHLGVYGQVVTYDFELGGVGHIGGVPGKNIFHDPSFGAGLEYGYTIPLGKHFNLDFSIGAGYLGGNVREYIPNGNEYVIKDTYRRNWFGPTRVDISLYWLIGFENKNKQAR